MQITIQIFRDGENQPIGLNEITEGWFSTWNQFYHEFGTITFEQGPNLKEEHEEGVVPDKLKNIAFIRNPDLSFVIKDTQVVLGGVEITVHSPDGSNAEKRYPFLWASGQVGTNGLILCPYQKTRPTGGTNRLPNRHVQRNLKFLEDWNPSDPESFLRQIIPIYELQLGSVSELPDRVQNLLLDWKQIGEFYAHFLALILVGPNEQVVNKLTIFKRKLVDLAEACLDSTDYTEPSSLLKLEDKWIQIYNTRPDSGHWERGEGQFDSIDGRLMFTLDEIERLPESDKPKSFEFWLPQLVSKHPWVSEQIERGFGSKRFRNIMVTLADKCFTKFADQLTNEDWNLLENNPGLLLERLDWEPGIYKVTSLVKKEDRAKVAKRGLKGNAIIYNILEQLNRDDLYFSTHRAYIKNWRADLIEKLSKIESGATVLIPRIPQRLLPNEFDGLNIIPAESCTKLHLMTIRQLHRGKE
jgi:hypothetical protein